MNRGFAALAAALVLCSCSGPHKKLSVGAETFGTDVQFGADTVQAAPPVAPGGVTIAPPSIATPFIQPPAVPTPVGSSPSVVPVVPPVVTCPSASPFAVALLAATTSIAKPPKPGKYVYRNDGTYKSSGAVPVSLAYPATSTREVAHLAKTTEGGFTYDVTNTLGGLVAQSTYEYIPQTNAALQGTPTSGLYLTKLTQTSGGKVVSSFSATGLGLLLLQTPAIPGNKWTSTAYDATSGAVIQAEVTMGASETVNACGQVIQTITSHLSGGIGATQSIENQQVNQQVPGPVPTQGTHVEPLTQTSTSFTADYAWATQYGGLSVKDTVDESGTQGGVGVVSHNTSTIDSVPVAP